MRTLHLALYAALVLTPSAHAGKFYKWVDDQGVTHYTTTPPEDSPAVTVDVKTGERSTGAPEESGQPIQDQAASEGEKSEQSTAVDEEKQAQIEQRNAENCEIAKRNEFNLTHRDRILVKDEKTGEDRYLTPEELSEWRTRTKSDLEQYCSPQ